jgi:hypothetical protein
VPTAFPAIQPTSRQFTSTSESQAQDGTRTMRLWGTRAVDGGLEMEFANIANANAKLIRDCHVAANGPIDSLTLPSIITNGDANLLAEASGLTFHWIRNEPPTTLSVSPGRSTVRVRLRCEYRPS